MCSLFFSLRASTTCSKNERLLLMCYASISWVPAVPVFLVLSDPARSTKCSFELTIFSVDSTLDLDSMWTVKMAWDLDEWEFSSWAAYVLLISPSNSYSIASSSVSQWTMVRFLTATPPFWSSRIESLAAWTPISSWGARRSTICTKQKNNDTVKWKLTFSL